MTAPNAKTTFTWDEESTKKMVALWMEGYSASEVAFAMGHNLSRNSIIGKVHRLKLKRAGKGFVPGDQRKRFDLPKAPSKPRQPKQPKVAAVKVAAPAEPAPPVIPAVPYRPKADAWKALPGVEPVALVDLERGMCRWPIGEGKPFMFCGASAKGKYCTHHRAVSLKAQPVEAVVIRPASFGRHALMMVTGGNGAGEFLEAAAS